LNFQYIITTYETKLKDTNISILVLPYTMSGSVTELSAIFVDKMIFLEPAGGGLKTDSCSSAVIVEWRGLTHQLRPLKNECLSMLF
jgi:hypothetical protein